MIDTLCRLCGAAEWVVGGGVCMHCAITTREKGRTEDKMDIDVIQLGEQWLEGNPDGYATETIKALLSAVKQERENSAKFLQILERRDQDVIVPVFQTKFGDKEGNCFAACLASLLRVDIDIIPAFYSLYQSLWFYELQKWLASFGLAALLFSADKMPYEIPPNCYYIIGGMSKRGIAHSVIGVNGKMAHDPYPGGTGLTSIEDYTFLVKTFYPHEGDRTNHD